MVTEFVVICLIALIVLYAYRKKKIDISAVIMTAIVGFSCFFSGGVRWIVVLLLFFVFGNLVSHYKKAYKGILGCEQAIRTWKNVFGNGGATMIFAIWNWVIPNPVWFLAMCGAMACATADTFATELGQVFSKNPRMVHTLKKVRPGETGAVSKEGFMASIFGAFIISIPLLVWGYSVEIFLFVVMCGFSGCVIDSLMGAILEKRKIVDTHQINFLATLLSGILCLIILI